MEAGKHLLDTLAPVMSVDQNSLAHSDVIVVLLHSLHHHVHTVIVQNKYMYS